MSRCRSPHTPTRAPGCCFRGSAFRRTPSSQSRRQPQESPEPSCSTCASPFMSAALRGSGCWADLADTPERRAPARRRMVARPPCLRNRTSERAVSFSTAPAQLHCSLCRLQISQGSRCIAAFAAFGQAVRPARTLLKAATPTCSIFALACPCNSACCRWSWRSLRQEPCSPPMPLPVRARWSTRLRYARSACCAARSRRMRTASASATTCSISTRRDCRRPVIARRRRPTSLRARSRHPTALMCKSKAMSNCASSMRC